MDDTKGTKIPYRDANRDRTLGEANRTGRHFDVETDASEDNEGEG